MSEAECHADLRKDRELQQWLQAWQLGNPPENMWVGASVENQALADQRIPELLKIPTLCRFLSVEPILEAISLSYPVFNGVDSFSGMMGIDWVISGGESGPNARPCNVAWIRDVIRQCNNAGVPVFVKQLGAVPVFDKLPSDSMTINFGESRGLLLKDRKGGNPDEWPEDLKRRQFPQMQPAR